MTKTKPYLFHELSSVFPLIEGEEFDLLVKDIKEHGQLEEGVLFEGKILDGRNRYRACKILNIPFKAKEFGNNISPLDYIISTNLHRRHLTIAQRAEIGLILLEEEEKKAKERQIEIAKIKAETMSKEGERGFHKINDKTQIEVLSQKIDEIKEEDFIQSTKKIAPKVKIGNTTLSKAKKIKEAAKEDKSIANKWEEAKQGKIGVDAVYKEVKKKEIIQKLPEPLKKEVENKELTVKEAKTVAESYEDPKMQQDAIKTIKKEKKQHEMTMNYISDVIQGKTEAPVKVYKPIEERLVRKFQGIAKEIIINMTMRNVKSHNENIQPILIKIMRKCFEHLQKELQSREIIDA